MKPNFLFIFLITINCFSQINFDSGEIKVKKYFEEIIIEEIFNKIIVPVTINGKKYKFLLDTGAPNVISKKVFEELNLKNTSDINITDANNIKQKMEFTIVPNIQIGNLSFENQIAVIYDIENHNLLSCYNIDGFIGSNLLRNSVIKISKKNLKITISDQIKLLNPKTKPTKIELLESQKSPYIPINFTGKNNNKAKDMALIDTGMDGFYDMSNRAFKIFEESSIFEVLSSSNGTISIGLFGAGNTTPQKLLSVKETKLNNTFLDNLIFNTTNDENSRIGIDFIKYGDLIIDYKNKKAYFESEDKIDITINNKIQKFNATVIDNKFVIGIVWDKELLNQMNAGDEIISIDSKNISEMQFCEILSLRTEMKNKDKYILEIKNKDNVISKINISNN